MHKTASHTVSPAICVPRQRFWPEHDSRLRTSPHPITTLLPGAAAHCFISRLLPRYRLRCLPTCVYEYLHVHVCTSVCVRVCVPECGHVCVQTHQQQTQHRVCFLGLKSFNKMSISHTTQHTWSWMPVIMADDNTHRGQACGNTDRQRYISLCCG